MEDLNFVKCEKTKVRRVYFIVATITIILTTLAINFAKYILTQEYISAEKQLKQSVLQTASNLRGRVSVNVNELNTLSAKFSASVKSLDEEDVLSFLSDHIMDYDYNVLFFAYPNGKIIKYQQGVGKLKSENWTYDNRFQTVLGGGPVYVVTKNNSNDKVLKYTNEFAVPVYGDDKIVGVLGAQFDADIYMRILSFNNYDKQGISYVIDKEGKFLIKPQRDKDPTKYFFDRNIKLINKTQHEILEMLDEEQHGSFLFTMNGKKYAAAFAPVDNNNKTINRHVLTVVPFDALVFHVGDLLRGLIAITIIISASLIGFLCYSNFLLIRHTDVITDIAFVDKITGYDNKNKFLIKSKEIIDNNPNKKFAIICAEISKFKAINELLGFEDANIILKDFSSILVRNLNKVGICARDHSSTFAILCEYDKEEYIEKYFIQKIIDDVEAYNNNAIPEFSRASGALLNTTLAVAFGIYLIDDRELTIDRMYEKANIAKRAIGETLKSSCRFYDDALRAQILQDKTIEDEMESALAGNQFHMFLQPKFDLQTKELAGAEALVRWIHPTKGLIPPMQFIPLFEKNGFVTELDKCIWKQACHFLSERQKEGLKLFPISVNVSRIHMENDRFIDELILLTRKYGIDPKYLELELTESACFNDEKRFEEAVNTLKNLGFVVSMDDFGTGYSSLNMLRKLPIDILKLDRGFIKDTIQDVKGQMVTRSIIEMANKLGMLTVAEGIETEEQAEFLRSVGCKIAQGFLYGKPVDIEAFRETFILKSV